MQATTYSDEAQLAEQEIQASLLHSLVENARASQLTAIGVSTVAALLLGTTSGSLLALPWWLLLVLVSLLRIAYLHFPASDDPEASRRLGRQFGLGLLASGCSWALLPFVVPQPSAYEIALYFIIIGGIGAGATTSLAPHRHLLNVFLVPALSGLLLCLLWYSPEGSGYLAATVLLYLLGMNSIHRNQHNLLRRSIENQLQLENSRAALKEQRSGRQQLERKLEERNRWTSHFLGITADTTLDFESKAGALLQLLHALLRPEGIVFCSANEHELVTLQQIDARGRLAAPRTRCHLRILEGADEQHLRFQQFPAERNPLGRIFDRDIRAAHMLRLVVEGRLQGAIIIAQPRDAEPELDDTQKNLVHLAASWLAMELVRHAAMSRLEENRNTMERIADSVPCLIAFVNSDLHYAHVNLQYAESLGRSREDIVNRPVQQVLHPSTFKLVQPFIRGVLSGKAQEFELEPLHSADERLGSRVFRVSYTPYRRIDGSIGGYYELAVDITADAKERQRLREKSSRDPVTGLRNSAWFIEKWKSEAGAGKLSRRRHLLVMDLDGHAGITEKFGHSQGDRALRNSAAALDSCRQDGDMLIRTRNGRFLMLLDSGDRSIVETAAGKCLAAINELPIDIRGETQHLGLSIGVSRIEQGADLKLAYRRATEALQASKERGRNRHTFHFE